MRKYGLVILFTLSSLSGFHSHFLIPFLFYSLIPPVSSPLYKTFPPLSFPLPCYLQYMSYSPVPTSIILPSSLVPTSSILPLFSSPSLQSPPLFSSPYLHYPPLFSSLLYSPSITPILLPPCSYLKINNIKLYFFSLDLGPIFRKGQNTELD